MRNYKLDQNIFQALDNRQHKAVTCERRETYEVSSLLSGSTIPDSALGNRTQAERSSFTGWSSGLLICVGGMGER